MLKPSPIQRFNVEPTHPYFVPELEFLLEQGKVLVTVDDKPIEGVLAFSVPDNYVKVVASDDRIKAALWVAKDKYVEERIYRDGIRLKGTVRVFVES